ncbi:unnamed protein product [Candida verbasci]|uniref:Uncharacterized protein n=1 Tax=Candida verbasci TaxID=1227364 RepID=A0A9W4U2Q9_9ASCO|nr:unnamed protein product [Candida verbasci]
MSDNSIQEPIDSTNSIFSFFKNHYIIIFLCLFILGLLLYHFRFKLIALHDRYRTRTRFSNGFYEDLNDGLSSINFDLESNIENEDIRDGLNMENKNKIKKIMKDKGLNFDDARLELIRNELHENEIDEDGVPKDPKLVTFK